MILNQVIYRNLPPSKSHLIVFPTRLAFVFLWLILLGLGGCAFKDADHKGNFASFSETSNGNESELSSWVYFASEHLSHSNEKNQTLDGKTKPSTFASDVGDEKPSEENLVGPQVWGQAGLRGFLTGSQVAPNGIEFNPLFFLNLDFNF